MGFTAAWGAAEWLAAGSTAAAAVGAGVSAYSSVQAGKAREQAAQYQAAVAKNNQTLAEAQAQMEIQRGARLEDEKRRETASREGAIRAAAGASGVDVNDGSPLRLASDTAELGELDAQTIRSNAQRAAFGYRTKGMDYAAQASLDMMAAEDANRSGSLGAFSSLISGASSVSDKWSKYKEAGVF